MREPVPVDLPVSGIVVIPEPPLSVAERAKRDQRTSVLLKWVCALRELREEEARGIVRPLPTQEQPVEAKALMDRFRRWLAGDDGELPQSWDAEPQR